MPTNLPLRRLPPCGADPALALLLDSLPLMLIYVDRGDRLRFVNAAYRDWLARTGAPAEPLGQDVDSFLAARGLSAELRRELKACRARALAGERVHHEAVDRGAEPPVYMEIDYVPDAAGCYVIVNDVSQRRRAEAALAQTRDRLAAVLQGVGDGITVENAEGVVLFANHRAGELLGLDAHGLLGGNLTEVLASFDWRDEARRPLAASALPGRRILDGEPGPIEQVARFECAASGRKGWLSIHATRSREGSGETVVINILRDFTARKGEELERERLLSLVAAERARLEAVLQQLPAGVLIVEACGRVVLHNRKVLEIWGIDELDSGADPFAAQLRATRPDGQPLRPQEWASRRAIAAGAPVLDEELRIVRADGRVGHLLQSAVPIRGPGGRVVAAALSLQDVTALREHQHLLEEKERNLEQAVRARDEFIGIASHELRTPITSMKLHLEMLQRADARGQADAFAPERVRRVMAQSARSLERLTRLVEEMLDSSRLQSGRLTITREPVDLCEVVGEVIERTRPQLEAVETPLSFHCLAPRISGWFDRFRVEQVLGNLLSNAARYARGRPVRVCLGLEASRAVMTVADQGPGVPLEARERIFERFERLVSPSECSGLGLGLYIVREIVAAHGGDVRVEGEPGQGAIFVVSLPLAPPPGAPEPQSSDSYS